MSKTTIARVKREAAKRLYIFALIALPHPLRWMTAAGVVGLLLGLLI